MKLKEKLNTLFKSNEFKASLWSVLFSFVIAIPFMIIFVILLLQNSYITYGFWFAILFISIIFVLVLSFGNVIYKKLGQLLCYLLASLSIILIKFLVL